MSPVIYSALEPFRASEFSQLHDVIEEHRQFPSTFFCYFDACQYCRLYLPFLLFEGGKVGVKDVKNFVEAAGITLTPKEHLLLMSSLPIDGEFFKHC